MYIFPNELQSLLLSFIKLQKQIFNSQLPTKNRRIKTTPENRTCFKRIRFPHTFFEKRNFLNCFCGEMSEVVSFMFQTLLKKNLKLTRTLNWYLIRFGLCGAISFNKLDVSQEKSKRFSDYHCLVMILTHFLLATFSVLRTPKLFISFSFTFKTMLKQTL